MVMTSLFDNLPGFSAGSSTALPAAVPPREDEDATAVAPAKRPAEDLLEGLNPQQRAAVVHEGGQLLIIAGAGSGKTRVLTHRFANLLATGRAREGEYLVITYNINSGAAMR